jgi:nicotinate dehydrogenase subunit B
VDADTDVPLGVGEATAGPMAAAIGNAASRALGIRIRDLPLTRERVMAETARAVRNIRNIATAGNAP